MSSKIKQYCLRCVLPDTFPGISFNEEGICRFCRESPSRAQSAHNREVMKQNMEEVIAKHKGSGEYDCLVAFSGGKDSSYTLKLLVNHYQLRCLAVTIDNGFISEQAHINCKTVTKSLGTDHIFFTPAPDFMNRMYLKSATESGVHTPSAIKRASNICNSCINLINNYMVKLSLQNNIPLIAGGYIGGQIPKDSAVLVLNSEEMGKHKLIANRRYIQHFGLEADKYYGLPDSLNGVKKEIIILNPMLTLAISEEEIIKNIEELGWVKTQDTGKNSSNCRLNDLGIAVHYRQYGFNPYIMELAQQVRDGTMNREHALAKAESIPEQDEVAWQAAKIGLNFQDLKPT